MKESFIIRKKYQEQIDLLNTEQKSQLLDAIFPYQTEWSPPEWIDPLVSMLLSVMIQERTKDDEQYKVVCERNRKNWKSGWRPNKNFGNSQKPSGLSGNPEKPKKADNDSDNDLINSSNEELKDNKLNKTTSLKKIEEEKKEKNSAKKEKNAEVRERNVSLLELIKQKVESLGLIYKAWEMERISATNICTAKVFGSVATKFWLSPPELAIAVIEASAQDQFRAGKIYNAEMVYKHYEKVINQAKASFQKKQNQIAKVKRV